MLTIDDVNNALQLKKDNDRLQSNFTIMQGRIKGIERLLKEKEEQLESIPAYVREGRFGSSPHNACCRETFELLMQHLESQYRGAASVSASYEHVCKISINPSKWEREFLTEIANANLKGR